MPSETFTQFDSLAKNQSNEAVQPPLPLAPCRKGDASTRSSRARKVASCSVGVPPHSESRCRIFIRRTSVSLTTRGSVRHTEFHMSTTSP